MNDNRRMTSSWDWLENPGAVLELYNAERKAYYEWDTLSNKWSKATRDLNSRDRKLPKKKRKELKALKKRLNRAANAYDVARTRLHEAWTA